MVAGPRNHCKLPRSQEIRGASCFCPDADDPAYSPRSLRVLSAFGGGETRTAPGGARRAAGSAGSVVAGTLSRAALYVRVSTREQSTETQEAELRRWADRLGLEAARVYACPALSNPSLAQRIAPEEQ